MSAFVMQDASQAATQPTIAPLEMGTWRHGEDHELNGWMALRRPLTLHGPEKE